MNHLRDAVGPDELSCDELREHHGDYLDGLLPVALMARVETHLDGCVQCARYDRVVRRGLQLVQALPDPAPSDDFEERLQHRIFHLQDGAALLQERPAAGVAVAAAVSGLIALVAWSPLLFDNAMRDTRTAIAESEPTLVVPMPAADPLGVALATWYPGQPTSLPTTGNMSRTTVFPGPYSPLIVSPPVHGGAVRTISTEYRATE